MKGSISTGEADFACRILLRCQNDKRCQNKAQTDAMDALHGLHDNRQRKFGWVIGVISP